MVTPEPIAPAAAPAEERRGRCTDPRPPKRHAIDEPPPPPPVPPKPRFDWERFIGLAAAGMAGRDGAVGRRLLLCKLRHRERLLYARDARAVGGSRVAGVPRWGGVRAAAGHDRATSRRSRRRSRRPRSRRPTRRPISRPRPMGSCPPVRASSSPSASASPPSPSRWRIGEAVALIGIVGGYVAPAVYGGGDANAPFLVIYLTALSAVTYGVIRYRSWWRLSVVGLIGPAFWGLVWVSDLGAAARVSLGKCAVDLAAGDRARSRHGRAGATTGRSSGCAASRRCGRPNAAHWWAPRSSAAIGFAAFLDSSQYAIGYWQGFIVLRRR